MIPLTAGDHENFFEHLEKNYQSLGPEMFWDCDPNMIKRVNMEVVDELDFLASHQ